MREHTDSTVQPNKEDKEVQTEECFEEQVVPEITEKTD